MPSASFAAPSARVVEPVESCDEPFFALARPSTSWVAPFVASTSFTRMVFRASSSVRPASSTTFFATDDWMRATAWVPIVEAR
ncbi:hypothetical protein QE454_001304 [Microbacterium sp. SORGH_AS454]|nr:hypothetical protein [Microbacterium sp. SORGH_AS_0454]MDR6097685.1 hypothetical protein [Microbacterium sp. SORGH_AS_0454]